MGTPVVLKRLALAEFDDAVDWFDRRRAGAGTAFAAALRDVLAQIGAQPDRYPEVHADIREAPVARYLYAVYYRPEPARVVVIAEYHTSRDPSGWQGRA